MKISKRNKYFFMLICTLEFYPYFFKFLLLSPILFFHLIEYIIDLSAECLSHLSENKVNKN